MRSMPPRGGWRIGLHPCVTAPLRPLSKGLQAAARGRFPAASRRPRVSPDLSLRLRGARRRKLRSDAKVFRHVRPRPRFSSTAIITCICCRRSAMRCSRSFPPAARECVLRQCVRAGPARTALSDPKGSAARYLELRFRRRAAARAVAHQFPAFAGTYEFDGNGEFRRPLFPRFLDCLPDGSVVMCHPGFVRRGTLSGSIPLDDTQGKGNMLFRRRRFSG